MTSAAISLRSRILRPATPLLSIVLIALTACAGSIDTPGVSLAVDQPSVQAQTPAVSNAGVETGAPSPGSAVSPDHPPVVRLHADGGDPVAGQLGTFVWAGNGSDSAWLRGAPLSVGAGEPLSVEMDPSVPIADWRARYVPATATDPAGATALGAGPSPIAFAAPAKGAWTVEIAIRFDGAIGSASYFWRLDVR